MITGLLFGSPNAFSGDLERQQVQDLVAQKYPKASRQIIERVVTTAYSLANGQIFTPLDLVAIVGVESKFKPKARNRASKGVMQVNKGSYSVEKNMATGYALLEQYQAELGTKGASIKAYNLGIGGYKRGRRTTYLSKINTERLFYERNLRGTSSPASAQGSPGGKPHCGLDPNDILNGIIDPEYASDHCSDAGNSGREDP